MKILKNSEYLHQAWKNGRGHTEQIAISPEGSDFRNNDFEWRLSTARIPEDGPFSFFPGYQRLLILLEGPGIKLSHGLKEPKTLSAFEPYLFSGDEETRCQLVGGPVKDLSFLWKAPARLAGHQIMLLKAGEHKLYRPQGKINLCFLIQGKLEGIEVFDTLVLPAHASYNLIPQLPSLALSLEIEPGR